LLKAAPLILLGLAGCSYLADRGADFGDCWKAEAHLTFGYAWVHAGPVAHEGIGFPEEFFMGQTIGGWRYAYALPHGMSHSDSSEQLYGIFTHVSSLSLQHPGETRHRCFVLLPPLLSTEGIHRNVLHDFDFEVGAGMLLGFTVGFSLGEFLDFLLGWFGLDIAGDDGPKAREDRRPAESYYRARAGASPIVIPRKEAASREP